MIGDGKVVCVTGASGFIASWLVKLLLQRGYTVKASVRDPGDPNKRSFDPAIEGCVGVFHTASPVSFSATDPQAELVDPAVKGTLNVLKSCAKYPSVKRVVLTSSTAAVFHTGRRLTQDSVADESWFSDPAICEQLKLWYPLSKTLAEIAAWDFAKENGIDLVTLLPGFVTGPLLQPTICFSVEMILNLVNGLETYPNIYYRSVDVRDVVEAHVKAFETPSAAGRYCLVGSIAHFSQVLGMINELYPTLHLPDKCGFFPPCSLMFTVSTEKAESLGIKFTPMDVSIRDTIESLKAKGFLQC
ncbi:unnamed protein product [Linum tenue]|uniref:NAD-dependent epimerase/dehydratase domain-containing protein n=1 Tax=Linum tenue TaxID=586396 RepID=A0AAV0KGK1_9ROSI|nr:unnamed protein product [Linum tenue]